MTRPEKFLTASEEDICEAWLRYRGRFVAFIRELIIPAVAREVQEESDKTIESLRADNLRLLMERVDILALSNPTEN